MAINVIAAVLAMRPDVISATQRFVLVSLANHASPDGSTSFPSVETISRETSIGERAVQKALLTLKQRGLIRPEKEYRRATHYSVNLVAIHALSVDCERGSQSQSIHSESCSELEHDCERGSESGGIDCERGSDSEADCERDSSDCERSSSTANVVHPNRSLTVIEPKNKNSDAARHDRPAEDESRPRRLPTRQLLKLAHVVVDDQGESASIADIADDMKTRCVRLNLAFTPDAITGAISSCLKQREVSKQAKARNDGRRGLTWPINRTGPAAPGKYAALTNMGGARAQA